MSSESTPDADLEDEERPLTMRESVVQALASWRTAAVSLLSFASGLPLGLVWIAIPDWMRSVGVDIRIVGLFTLAQAPWAYKMVWAPLMDRYTPPLLGRRRGWALVAQIVLSALILMLAGLGHHPDTPWVVLALTLALAFTAASQDIAIDAYTVEVLKKQEQGAVVGARIAFYRAAMYVAGGVSITLAGATSWPLANALMALLFLPMMLITWKAPPPPRTFAPPKTLREAVWHPFLGFLARHRALEILAFVLLYKIADNLAEGLLRPFLFDKGFSAFDRGISLATIGLLGIVGGTFIGGLWTNVMGLGRSLWFFGFLQIFSNLGYVILAGFPTGPDHPPDQLQTFGMYAALSFEKFTSGLGTGAFSVLLLRMTQKRFSATQYALFTSMFAIPRIVAGPIAGFAEHAYGWQWFFWGTILAGIPGLLMLQRFSPWGTREPRFTVEPPRSLEPLPPRSLLLRGVGGGLATLIVAVPASAFLVALSTYKKAREELEKVGEDLSQAVFDYGSAFASLIQPATARETLPLVGIVIFAAVIGLCAAAVAAARHGAGQMVEEA